MLGLSTAGVPHERQLAEGEVRGILQAHSPTLAYFIKPQAALFLQKELLGIVMPFSLMITVEAGKKGRATLVEREKLTT